MRNAGSLLVVTLWLVAILSVLAIAIARSLSLEIRLAKYRLAREQARTLARGGVYAAMQRLDHDARQPNEGYDWLADDWATFADTESEPEDPTTWLLRLEPDDEESARTAVRIVDEERKLTLNRIINDPTVYRALGTLLDAPALAARLFDYLDADADALDPDGLEVDDAVQPPYTAKNGPLVAHEEVLSIPGWSGEELDVLRQWTTVAEPSAKLNINTVAPEVLVALGFSEAAAQAIADCRQQGVIFDDPSTLLTTAESCVGAAGISPAEQSLLANQFGVASRTFTVISEGIVQEPPVRARVEAIVQRSLDGATAPQILAWREP